MRRQDIPACLAIGLATGLLSGLMGVGGGIIAIPAMVTYLRVSQHQAHGTSLAMIVLTAAASVLVYASRGQVDLHLALVLTAGTVVGAYLGARTMPLIHARHLGAGFGFFILIIGLRMVVG